MLDVFKGELFIHPAALDYSGNTCSHACAYCFASLRSADRRFSIAKLGKLCLGRSTSGALGDALFNLGYPVCVSNRSDPFCKANGDNTRAVLELLDLVPNGVFFQTKGVSDPSAWRALDAFRKKNVVMYITISSTSPEISRRIEPGAPDPADRIELARYAKSRGWEVIIGINPCVGQWMPEEDLISLEDTLLESGIDRYLVMPLSLNSRDATTMSGARREMLEADGVLDETIRHDGQFYHWVRQYRRMNRRGLHAYSVCGPLPCHMDDLACAKLGKHMNSVQHFTDYAWDEHARSGKTLFTFPDFLRVMTDGNPEMAAFSHPDMYKYILCINRAVWKAGGLAKTARTFPDVYRVLWNSPSMVHSPCNLWCFTRLVDGSGRPVRDERGDMQLVFLGGGPIASRDRKAAMTAEDLREKGVILKW